MLERRLLLSGAFANDLDVGSPALAGSMSYSNGTYTVNAGGTDIGGSSDQFHFAYNSWSSDGSVIAKVTSLANTNGFAKAGLMFRSGTGANAAFAGMFITPTNGITFIARAADGDTAGSTIAPGFTIPRYLKLSRTGSQFGGFYSLDGSIWSQLGSTQSVTIASTPLVGLAVTSRNAAALTTSTFTNVSLLLPPAFNDSDVGAPPLPGFAVYDPAVNTFVMSGAGSDIGGTSDQFNFASRTMTGDGSITALATTPTNTDPSAKAGVMIRDSSSAGAIFAGLSLTSQNGLVFQWRTTTNGTSSSFSLPGIAGPVWLRVAQQGGSFSSSYSSNGTQWVKVGSAQSISMASATTLAGLAITSHNNSALTSATFSSVSIPQDGWSDADIGSPALRGSATYDPPSNTYTLVGGGASIGVNRRAAGAAARIASSDQLNFASRTMTGDGSVIAYVNAIANTDPLAQAGVMIRADGSASAAFAGVFITAQNGVVFSYRASSGALVQQKKLTVLRSVVAAPVSLKLTRAGNAFSGFYSTDGENWVAVGTSQSIAMLANVPAGIAVSSHNDAALCTATFTGVSVGRNAPPGSGVFSAAEELFLDDLEFRHLQFYWTETNANTGLVPDAAGANGGSPSAASSIAAIGFGLTALTIGDQRGWLTHANAYQRALNTVTFLYNSGASVNGFFYHFLNPVTGARFGGSELSSVDTAELMAGVLNVAQYWVGTPLATTAMNLFNRVNWPFMQKPNGQFYGAWTPESGFSGGYVDFSEAVVLYLLGLGSATHPISQSSWYSWARAPLIHYGGYTYYTATDAALFTVQYPQAWFDLRGLTDSTGINYYTNAQTATLAQRQWMTDISNTWPDYGPNMWGLTPSDSINGYAVWGGPPAFGPIDGTVVPTGPGGSLAFTPRESVDALKHMYQTYGSTVYKKYGFVDAFNPLNSWTSSKVLGIDVGMTLIAAENARSNFVWNVFNKHPAADQSVAEAFVSPSKSAWMVRGSGNWNTPANWSNGVVPNGTSAEADFFGAIPGGRTVFTDVPVTAATLDFNHTSTYVITGAGSLTLQSSNGLAQVIVEQGTHEIDLPLTIASDTVLNVALGATLVIGDPMNINPGRTVTVIGGGTVIYQSTGGPNSASGNRAALAFPRMIDHKVIDLLNDSNAASFDSYGPA